MSAPATLFLDTFMRPQVVNHTSYEVFPDGRVLVFEAPPNTQEIAAGVVGVFNWLDEVRGKIK